MNIRLLPVLMFAATALLSLKALDLLMGKDDFAPAAAASTVPPPESATKEATPENDKTPLLDRKVDPRKEKIELPESEKSSELSLNERLSERRRQLDERNKEMDMRENLLKTAEKNLENKIEELKKLQAVIDAHEKSKNDEAQSQIKNLVTMYEGMKPKDAARIFDKLDLGVMMEVVTRMNPKITSSILAAMSSEAAQKLTVQLAMRSIQANAAPVMPKEKKPAKSEAPNELPRIDQAPPAGKS